MKFHRFVLSVALVSLSAMAFGQTAAQTDTQKSFDKLKALAGSWDGSFLSIAKKRTKNRRFWEVQSYLKAPSFHHPTLRLPSGPTHATSSLVFSSFPSQSDRSC